MLLAFDLDRTLVTDDFRLSDEVIDAVRTARRRGHLVTILTGRARAAASDYIEQLEVCGPYSVNHGALVRENGRTLRRICMTAADVRSVLGPYLEQDPIEFSCVVEDSLFVRDPRDERWRWAHTQNRLVQRFSSEFAFDADKVVFAPSHTSSAVDARVARELPHLTRYLWGDGFLEVIGAGADKGSALALIASSLGVPREQVVAFGDGLNDASMLSWAGHGVAVGPHAHPDTLAVADEHVASPEEGGVVAWLEEHAR